MSRLRDAGATAGPWLRRVGLLLVLVVVVEYVVLPRLLSAGDDLTLLGSARPGLLVAALLLELASLACFTLLTRATLPAAQPLSSWTLLRVDLTGYGVSHVVPGGGATAAAFRYRLLTRAGLAGDDVFAGAMVQTAAALVALVGVFAAGTALSLQATTGQAGARTAGLVALVLLVVVGTAGVLLTVRREASLATLHRLLAPLPLSHAASLEDAVTVLTERTVLLTRDRRLLVRTLGWAAANWLLDAACLWCCLRAYGWTPGLGGLLTAYGVVNLLAMLPLTPGGLGVVEGVLVPATVSLGAAPAVALLGVLTWRLGQYWLPIPLALLTYLSLRLGPLRSQPPRPPRPPQEMSVTTTPESPHQHHAEHPRHHPAVARELARAEDVQLRTADLITRFAGSMPFVYAHVVAFAVWMLVLERSPWPTLTLVVSLEAIFLSTFVMIGQNRQAVFQQVKADHDFCAQEHELYVNSEMTRTIEHLVRDIHLQVTSPVVVDDDAPGPCVPRRPAAR